MTEYSIKNGLGEASKSTHPLNEQEILHLLECAHNASDREEMCSVLVRLWQACGFWQASGQKAQTALPTAQLYCRIFLAYVHRTFPIPEF